MNMHLSEYGMAQQTRARGTKLPWAILASYDARQLLDTLLSDNEDEKPTRLQKAQMDRCQFFGLTVRATMSVFGILF